LSSSASGCTGPCSPSVAFDNATTHFTSGAALVDAIANEHDSSRVTWKTDMPCSAWISTNSNDFTVASAALDSFSWSHVNDQTAGARFSAPPPAYDASRHVKSTLFPYTTLFRSLSSSASGCTGPCSPSVAFDNATTHFTSGAALVD